MEKTQQLRERTSIVGNLKDISEAQAVEVSVDRRRGVVWVNVDGVCALRVSHIQGPIIIEGVG